LKSSFRVLEEENERIGVVADRSRDEAVHDRAHRGVRASILFGSDSGRLESSGGCEGTLSPVRIDFTLKTCSQVASTKMLQVVA
jgi:hypothetical protein